MEISTASFIHLPLAGTDPCPPFQQDLQDRLNAAAETHAKASEDVAAEMIEHLKTLTEHMKELESTVDKGGHHPLGQIRNSLDGGFYAGTKADSCDKQRRIAQTASACQQFMSSEKGLKLEAPGVRRRGRKAAKQQPKLLVVSNAETVDKEQFRSTPNSPTTSSCDTVPPDAQFCSYNKGRMSAYSGGAYQQEQDSEDDPPLTTTGKQMILFSDDHSLSTLPTREAEHRARARKERGQVPQKMVRLKSWIAWKWRWAVAEAKARRLSRQITDFEQRLGTVFHGRNFIARHKLVPLVLSAWRSYTNMKRLRRKARRSQQSLDGLMAALPWWIRRVGERRRLEKIFSFWQRQALRSGRRLLAEDKAIKQLEVRSESPLQGVERNTRPCSYVQFGRSRHRVCPQRQRRRSPISNVHRKGQCIRNQKGQRLSYFQGYKQATESDISSSKDDIFGEPRRFAAKELAVDRGNLSTTTIARALRGLQVQGHFRIVTAQLLSVGRWWVGDVVNGCGSHLCDVWVCRRSSGICADCSPGKWTINTRCVSTPAPN